MGPRGPGRQSAVALGNITLALGTVDIILAPHFWRMTAVRLRKCRIHSDVLRV